MTRITVVTPTSDEGLRALLHDVADRVAAFRAGLAERRAGAEASGDALVAGFDGPLPDSPADPSTVVDELVRAAEPGLTAMPGPRFFGFVIGGSLPAALAADWLTSGWDQNAALDVASPAAAAVEEGARRWLVDVLGLPATASVGFVTGGQMANLTGLAAGRHEVLRRAGWDVERDGLTGAPRVRVYAGAERHESVDRALRFLGLGTAAVVEVAADAQGRLRPEALAAALRPGPAIVCLQAGNVNTGAVDPLRTACAIAHEAGAWVHVDGAFGLWAAAAPERRHLVDGVELADSWATDAHKWLNVPYDCGLAFTAHPAAHRAALGMTAAYLPPGGEARDEVDWNPELSRRARGFAVWAALRSLGRSGVADVIERCCALAALFARLLRAEPGVEVGNEVVLNQVLVRFGSNERTSAVAQRVQRDGTCWAGPTRFQGRTWMRISVSNATTREEDVVRSVRAILQAAEVAPTRS